MGAGREVMTAVHFADESVSPYGGAMDYTASSMRAAKEEG